MPIKKLERHPFKWMTFKGAKVKIDRDIAPLLAKMWELDINTTNSCQAHCNFACKHKHKIKKDKYGSYYGIVPTKNCFNCVWLSFSSCKDVEKFYNIVAEYTSDKNDNNMYSKMCCDRGLTTGQNRFRRAPDGWAFSFLMSNEGVNGHWGRPMWRGKRSTQEMWIEDGCDKNDFVIMPQITFPRAHMKYIEAKLDQAIKQKRSNYN